MPSQPLHTILHSFSKTEKLRLKDFVASPFFNKSQDVIDFLNLILDTPEISDEQCYARLYPGKTYVQRRIIDLSYRLACLAEDFLSQHESEDAVFDRKIKLLRSLQERGIEKAARSVSAELVRLQQEKNTRDSSFYLDEFLLQAELDRSFAASGRLEKDKSLQQKNDSLDLFYISSKLRDSCEMLNRTQIIQSEYKVGLVAEILLYLEVNKQIAEDNPVINIYYHIYKMLSEPAEEEFFSNLIKLLDRHGQLFMNEELRGMYNYAKNYCIRKVNSGNNDFYRPLFDINRQLLEKQLIFINAQLTQRDYKNITSIALRLAEYDWTINFISEYKSKLPKEQRDNAYAYNLANYYYETGKLKKAVQLLREVEFTDIFYNLDAKTMLLKIYFELEEDEAFFSLVAAFKIYLSRNRLINEHNRKLYMNLLIFTSKLYTLKMRHIFRKANVFQLKLKQLKGKVMTQPVANSRWLINKTEELIIS